MNSTYKRLATSLLILAPGLAAAQLAPAKQPPVLDYLQTQGVKVVEEFPAPGGLSGYIGVAGGRSVEFYVTPDGQNAIVGTQINARGEQVEQGRHDTALAQSVDLEALANAAWIAEGDPNAKQIIYTFIDPNCPYCAVFWEKSQPYLKAGGIQLRYLLVNTLRPDSLTKATAILGAKDPAAELARHEQALRERRAGVTPDSAPSPALKNKVAHNTELLRGIGLSATPAIIYRDEQGRTRLTLGVPKDHEMKNNIFRRSAP